MRAHRAEQARRSQTLPLAELSRLSVPTVRQIHHLRCRQIRWITISFRFNGTVRSSSTFDTTNGCVLGMLAPATGVDRACPSRGNRWRLSRAQPRRCHTLLRSRAEKPGIPTFCKFRSIPTPPKGRKPHRTFENHGAAPGPGCNSMHVPRARRQAGQGLGRLLAWEAAKLGVSSMSHESRVCLPGLVLACEACSPSSS